MLRLRLDHFFLVTLAVTVCLAACGSEDGADGSTGDGDTSTNPDGGPSGDDDDLPPIQDGPDVPPVAFPTAIPSLFGYALEDAFPGTFLSGAMDMDWPAGSTEPFVLQRGGHIVQLHGNGARDLVLNFEGSVAARGEGGTLGMALHPKFADAGDPHPYVYVWYNAEGTPTHQRLSRFTWNPGTKLFDPGSQLIMVEQQEGATEHNGAHIRFGKDGFLYFGNGDDTRSGETTQKLDGGLFSGVFRIDVDQQGGAVSHAPPRQPTGATTQGYFIPNDNPFVGVANANQEYFALGFRNPYSFNFDRVDGSLWLGDVGETFREEVNKVEKGGNYGWPFLEGTRKVREGAITIGTPKNPAYEYTHASIGDLVAIVAGYPYRGAALPELAGKVIYSDWPTGRVWALDPASGKRQSLIESNTAENAPVGWGQDAAGEVYLIAWSKIFKIVRAAPHGVPLKLSETKIFRNTQTLKIPTALSPYAIKSPLWSDGAAKQRWVYVPAGQTGTMNTNGTATLPPGSLLVKHFALPDTAKPTNKRTHKLETRILVVAADNSIYGLTYKWDAKGRDADLVLEGHDEVIPEENAAEQRNWHFPSTGECWSCHRAENRVLAFRGEQLNFALPDGAGEQLAALSAKGVFDATIASSPPALPSPTDPTATAEDRATSYLASNCSPCHHPGASYLGGGDTWNALPGVALGDRGLVDAPNHNEPMAVALGLSGSPLIKPGEPNKSILLGRLKTDDADIRMPPLGRTHADPTGLAVIEAWIKGMTP